MLPILIAVAVLLAVVAGGWVWYQRSMRAMTADDEWTPSGSRLTSGALQELPVPAYRVVYEVPPNRLDGIEHIVVGPCGVVALTTTMTALPEGPPERSAVSTAAFAARRGLVDELAPSVSCDVLARVHWAEPSPHLPPAVEIDHATFAVDGHRLRTWLQSMPARLDPTRVDAVWRALTVGLGRPDPNPPPRNPEQNPR